MNWRDLKPGDRVRVTFEAPVSFVFESSINLTLDPADDETETPFTYAEANAAKWELLEPTLRVGRAKHKHNGWPCDVLAIHDDLAWIRYDFNIRHEVLGISKLINIDEEPKP